jgi:putative addiction module CopG family antidote
MTITLRPELEQLIAEAIQSGAYQNPEEVIEHALEALRTGDDWLRDNKDSIHEKIERACDQFERGEFFTAEESRADMSNRKAAWRAGQQR